VIKLRYIIREGEKVLQYRLKLLSDEDYQWNLDRNTQCHLSTPDQFRWIDVPIECDDCSPKPGKFITVDKKDCCASCGRYVPIEKE